MKLFQYLLFHLSVLSVNMSSLSMGSCFFLLGQLTPGYFGNSRNKPPLFPSGSSKSPGSLGGPMIKSKESTYRF